MPRQPRLAHVRVARQTDRFDACVAFYRDALGFAVAAAFDDHAGYRGSVLEEPGIGVQLELTTHRDGSPASVAAADDLLVLYAIDRHHHEALVEGLEADGRSAVALENPYWAANGAVGFRDPDGRIVVLFPVPPP